jgi:hypothetical protein
MILYTHITDLSECVQLFIAEYSACDKLGTWMYVCTKHTYNMQPGYSLLNLGCNALGYILVYVEIHKLQQLN